MTDFIAGVDGCPAGWIAAIHPDGEPAATELCLFTSFADILAHVPELATIAIDIPIGFPDHVSTGGRGPDIAARRVLGQRQSAVFAMPSRAAVMCDDYREACSAALATSDPPRKVSKQAFNLFAKVREVDALMTPELQSRVFECHPEVAFWSLNDESPLTLAKKVKSRPNPPGLALRRKLLQREGYSTKALESKEFPTSKVGPDDILDACANATTATRIRHGTAHRFPDKPACDGRGLRMEIWG
ncbi:MAG: DUF429 domain-containing protein [Hyphomicrobiaceae bacterium]